MLLTEHSEKQARRMRAYEKILAKCKTEKARKNKERELARDIFKKWKYGRFIPREGSDSLTDFEKKLLWRYYPSWREEL